VEAIVMNASGCGVMVKEYGHLLRNDPDYAERAAKVSSLTFDLIEWLPGRLESLRRPGPDAPLPVARRVAFHPPCTLQHGQRIKGEVERLLATWGAEILPVPDSHLCCGSAGTYSVLQPTLARQLRDRKLDALQSSGPEVILSANMGCLTHLQSGSRTPMMHWIEWLDAQLAGVDADPAAVEFAAAGMKAARK
jgi:glycolate oxidase iron-sulfur subunit